MLLFVDTHFHLLRASVAGAVGGFVNFSLDLSNYESVYVKKVVESTKQKCELIKTVCVTGLKC